MTISVDIAGHVATVQLDRPDVGNALDLATARALRDAVQRFAGTPSLKVLILTATGRMFCAGGDVRAMAAASDRPAFVRELADTMHEALQGLRDLPVCIVAAVQGTAAGAGIGLVLAADIAIAAERAKFVSAYSRIGLTPDCGVTALLTGAVGARRAAVLTLTDITLDARQAEQWGLVSETCPDQDVDARVAAIVADILERPGAAVGETARLLRTAADRDYAAQLATESATIARLSGSDDAAARISAFAG